LSGAEIEETKSVSYKKNKTRHPIILDPLITSNKKDQKKREDQVDSRSSGAGQP